MEWVGALAIKQNEDFLRFLTMGAAGAAAVLEAMDRRHGHRTIELERYATANKIWAQKIKRLRLADLLCLDCGIRIEVRTKSKLAIRMSHSDTPGREWDAGLRDEDLVAFVAWRPAAGGPSPHHHFFRTAEMRSASSYAKLGPRKAPSEGAERDITWPATVPKHDGRVLEVDTARGVARYQPSGRRAQTYRLRDVPAQAYASAGQDLIGGEQFIFGCVDPLDSAKCPGRTWRFADDLDASSPTDRYVAVKAAGIEGAGDRVEVRLEGIADDPEEDERIRLEALGSLARINGRRFCPRLAERARQWAGGDSGEVALSLESIFVLSELGSEAAAAVLADLAADRALDSEPRSAAVWGLGTAGIDDARRVLPFLADPDESVGLHALAGIGPVDDALLQDLQEMLERGTDREAASASALLLDEGDAGVRILLNVAQRDDHASLWGQSALGQLPEIEVREAAGGNLGPKLEAVLSPMWISQRSWLNEQQGLSPLDLLRQQCVRHLGRGARSG